VAFFELKIGFFRRFGIKYGVTGCFLAEINESKPEF